MKYAVLLTAYIVFWLVIWVQMFLLLSFFFSFIIADYRDRIISFIKWFFWLLWYVYFLPLHKYGFLGWQNWVYYVRYGGFISQDAMQWVCEPFPWLVFMFFYTFLCFFYEHVYKKTFDHFLVFMLVVIGLVILTV